MFERNVDVTSLSDYVISNSRFIEQEGDSVQEAESRGRNDYHQLDDTTADIEGLNDPVQDLVGKRDVFFFDKHQQRLVPCAGLEIGFPGPSIIADITVLSGRTWYAPDPTSDWMIDELEFSISPRIPTGLFFRPIAGDEALVFMIDLPQSGYSTRYFLSPGYMGDSLVEDPDDRIDQIHNWRLEVESQLGEVSNLPDGWDSYDSNQIDSQVIVNAREILEEIMDDDVPAPQIVPMYNGGIQIEWHTGSIDFEIHLTPSSKGSFFWEDLDHREEREGEIPTDLAELRDCLIKLKRTA